MQKIASILDWLPQYRMPRRYADIPFLQLQWLVDSKEFNWQMFPVPTSPNSVLPGRGSWEDQVSIVPGSFLWGITAWSSHFAGFRFNIWDKAREQSLLIVQGDSRNFGGLTQTFPGPRGPFFLPDLYPITGNGLLAVRIVNQATVANDCQVALCVAQKGGKR